MKILLVGINAKYTHSALAVDYIYQACQGLPVTKLEFNINQEAEYIYGEIIKHEPDLVAFSTYIWNIEVVGKLTSDLAQTTDAILLWGGPEASFDLEQHFSMNPGLDIIVRGEGEITNRVLFESLEEGMDLSNVEGISYRKGEQIFHNPERPLIHDLDTIPSPFEGLASAPGKMVYYEMSRGCPFRCSYCLSSTIKGVRYFSYERIISDLDQIMQSGTKVVKLVDRTFNANEAASMRVMDYIVEHSPRDMVYHMELMAHLISDEFLDYLSHLPVGLFQFEIGIQSSNPKTLAAIERITDLDRLAYVVKMIRSFQNIHQHVDLIVGLPYEDYASFRNSFDYAYSLGAEKLQMGFLKVLKGSNILKDVQEHDIRYSLYPPYEVKSTKYLSANEVRRLKIIEDLVESFVNEDYFHYSLSYLLEDASPFDFFEDFSYWWEDHKFHQISHSRKNLYAHFYNYLEDRADIDLIRERLRLDYFIHERSRPGDYLKPRLVKRSLYYDLLDDPKIREKFGRSLETPSKTLLKDFAFSKFIFHGQERVYGVDYKNGQHLDITEDFERVFGIYDKNK